MKITLRLEKNGKYIEKQLTQQMICSLFDLSFDSKDKSLKEFFTIIQYIDDAMHKPIEYTIRNNKLLKHSRRFWLVEKPKWKNIKGEKNDKGRR